MKRTKARRDIKSKLIAAICMLMVSVIMLASTSYAWFTLSTAPEVKGIQTAVGANGNLEIALLSTKNSWSNPDNISSAVGDSSAADGKSPITANITWGNLVDLSHESYGLSMITLTPAQLNTGSGENAGIPVVGGTIAAQMLAVPMYGADGRVTELTSENTILAPYDAAKKMFAQVNTDQSTNTTYNPASTIEYGLRAIGGSTNRSAREIAYDTYMSQAAQAASIAKSNAGTSLSSYGAVLANIGIKGGMDPNATFTGKDLDDLQAMLNSIVGYETVVKVSETETKTIVTPGITDELETALTNYAIAAVASGWNGKTYESDEKFTEAMTALQANPATAYDLIGSLGDEFVEAGMQLSQITAAANVAQSKLTALKEQNKSAYTLNEVKEVIAGLFDTSTMTVCGLTVAEIKAEGGKAALLAAYADYNNNIVVDMKGGIYSEIADLVDAFSGKAKVEVPELGATTSILQANKTATVTKSVLNNLGTQIKSKPAPKGVSANPSISDAYGYVVDLAFRTNASDSKLLLQTDAEARIDGADTDTMGGGSNMTFTSVEGFSTDSMKSLMGKINVVFFENGTENKILAIAKLDTANATVRGNTVTAPLKIVKGTGFATDTEAVIAPLPSNAAVKISALVYLDGMAIKNADVGTGALSMTGRLNLQFSSSANLVPMDYSAGYAAANPVPEASTPAPSTPAPSNPTPSDPTPSDPTPSEGT